MYCSHIALHNRAISLGKTSKTCGSIALLWFIYIIMYGCNLDGVNLANRGKQLTRAHSRWRPRTKEASGSKVQRG